MTVISYTVLSAAIVGLVFILMCLVQLMWDQRRPKKHYCFICGSEIPEPRPMSDGYIPTANMMCRICERGEYT